MKNLAYSFLSVLILCSTAFAAYEAYDELSEPETGSCANGNILLANVGNYSVTPCKWIRLSTNSNYMVVCQIVYEDYAFEHGPSTPAQILQERQVESCLNLALLKFLQKSYGSLSDGELVRKYHDGNVRAKVEEDFPMWFDGAMDILKQSHKGLPVDGVLVKAVSMRAVGPFAEALDAW